MSANFDVSVTKVISVDGCRWGEHLPDRRRRARDDLKLELSQEKPLVTHAHTGAARFLGYEITVQHNDTKQTGRYRRVNGQIALHVPLEVIKAKPAPYLRRGKPAEQAVLTNGSDHPIFATSARRCRRWRPSTEPKS
ncbi:hypothetical protein AB0H00_29340 [Nocardia sp. NPDC023852]|uniref:hypothetical protein n=1 Tax=Nocardia sp. NPDC023852 TaxID=3154697 RepID=UPI0034092CEA